MVQGPKRKDELAAPIGDMAELVGQFGLQIPRPSQNHVWAVFGDALRVVNRDAHTWREAAMFVRIAVDDVLEQIAADPAVVEQGVFHARRTVADHALAVGVALKQEP
jgi:hypothetical protein